MQNGGYFFTRCSGEHEAGRGGRETREWEATEKSCLSPSWVSRAPSLLCARLKNAKKITAVGYKCIK